MRNAGWSYPETDYLVLLVLHLKWIEKLDLIILINVCSCGFRLYIVRIGYDLQGSDWLLLQDERQREDGVGGDATESEHVVNLKKPQKKRLDLLSYLDVLTLITFLILKDNSPEKVNP